MMQPTLDELVARVDSKYTLVVLAAKRARQILEREGDEEGKEKPVTRALWEIARGELRYVRPPTPKGK
jgi:DNA-directed RNA polymerase subunit omega